MVIRVYISGNSGNKEIVTHQQRIFMILNSLGIPNEPVDISAPGMEKDRDYMREKCKKKDGQRHPLPPQIFNGEEYRGDFDDFDVSNEDDVLEEFLGIARKDPAASAPPTGTTTDQAKQEPKTETPSDKLGAEPMEAEETAVKEVPPPPPPAPAEQPPPVEDDPEPVPDEPVKAEEVKVEVVEEEEAEPKRPRKARRPQAPPEELGPMWAPYQTRMVTQKGQVISTPKLILL